MAMSALKPPPVDIDPEITKSIAHALSSAPDAIEQLRLLLVDSIRKDPRYANKPINSYLATPLIHGSYVEDSIPIVSKPSQHVDKGKILPPKIKTEIEDIKAEPPSPPALSLPEELYVSDGNDSDSMDGLTLALGNDNRCKGCGESKWASNNRLIECVECHAYYHQECHIPPVLKSDVNDPRFVWYCNGCSPSNSLTKSHPVPLGISSSGPSLTSKSSSGKSSPHVSSRSSPLQSFSNKGSSGSKSSHSSKSSSSSSSSGSGSSSNNKLPQPKINLITADKRLQIMKKKAAKKQEETRSKRKTK
ncbi:unnamed protein product [Bemisia tabaci]|uniref:Integrator complex subunit 12 n=1 Tax=Bemisia tabaci TaxID=7038 RepID=A0A9P0CEZ8_BEMTA|nr:unnamed protein product [Bemisia tabaci]